MESPFSTIYLAADHAGFAHKELVKTHLAERGFNVMDCGADQLDEEDDYPDYISRAAKEVSRDQTAGAIIFGGSGQGEAMVAGRFPHVRATVCYGGVMADKIVKLGREHNNANVLSIGSRFIGDDNLLPLVDLWLGTAFSNEERHIRRLTKFNNIH